MKDPNKISYAIAKQVPDMVHGFTIHTNYGDIEIAAKDAAPFAVLADKLLEKLYLAALRGVNQ